MVSTYMLNLKSPWVNPSILIIYKQNSKSNMKLFKISFHSRFLATRSRLSRFRRRMLHMHQGKINRTDLFFPSAISYTVNNHNVWQESTRKHCWNGKNIHLHFYTAVILLRSSNIYHHSTNAKWMDSTHIKASLWWLSWI